MAIQMKSKFASRHFIWAVALTVATSTLIADSLTRQDEPTPKDGSALGQEAKGVYSEVLWRTGRYGYGDWRKMLISVFVQTSKTNVYLDYLAPINRPFRRFELRDSRGKVMVPRHGAELERQLPLNIATKDWPRSPAYGHHLEELKGQLWLRPGSKETYRSFRIQDLYQVDQEGDFVLTIAVSLYKFAADRQSVSRVDLPSVTTTVHLFPNRENN